MPMFFTKLRSFRFFLSVVLLAVVSLCLLPSAAQASESNCPIYDQITGPTLPDGPDVHAIIKKYRFWAKWMYQYQEDPSSDPNHNGFDASVCPICGADFNLWHVTYSTGSAKFVSNGYYRPYEAYKFDCTVCDTSIVYYYCRTYDVVADCIYLRGAYGAPPPPVVRFIGNIYQVVDFSANLVNRFFNFMLDNPFALVTFALPIFGICLSLVLRLKKGV